MEAALLSVFGYFSQLQLLVKQTNLTVQDFYLPATGNGFIFVLFVCIKLHDIIPMPGFIFFPMILMNAILIIGFDFAATSFVYGQSKAAIEE